MKDSILNQLYTSQNILKTLITKNEGSEIFFFDFCLDSYINYDSNIEFDSFEFWIEFLLDEFIINLNYNLYENEFAIDVSIYKVIDKDKMILEDNIHLYKIDMHECPCWTDIINQVKFFISIL